MDFPDTGDVGSYAGSVQLAQTAVKGGEGWIILAAAAEQMGKQGASGGGLFLHRQQQGRRQSGGFEAVVAQGVKLDALRQCFPAGQG